MSFKPIFKMFFTVTILGVRFLLTHPVVWYLMYCTYDNRLLKIFLHSKDIYTADDENVEILHIPIGISRRRYAKFVSTYFQLITKKREKTIQTKSLVIVCQCLAVSNPHLIFLSEILS